MEVFTIRFKKTIIAASVVLAISGIVAIPITIWHLQRTEIVENNHHQFSINLDYPLKMTLALLEISMNLIRSSLDQWRNS
ncbi:MAG: hypothetical protein ACRC4L_01370 [Mycoplasma sp.]